MKDLVEKDSLASTLDVANGGARQADLHGERFLTHSSLAPPTLKEGAELSRHALRKCGRIVTSMFCRSRLHLTNMGMRTDFIKSHFAMPSLA